MKSIVGWLVLAMASWIPLPERPLHDEPLADYAARRTAIAEDLLAVASDPAEEPPFEAPDARARTALFMASIASLESAYAAHRFNRAQKWLDREPVPRPTADDARR